MTRLKDIKMDAILCYVKGQWAYFTTATLGYQWGDDWDDAPYEHNAGDPYEWDKHMKCAPYEVFKVAFHGDFREPCTDVCNSSYSVKQINAGFVAWLSAPYWGKGPCVAIHAGTTLSEFISKVRQAGGEVYLPVEV